MKVLSPIVLLVDTKNEIGDPGFRTVARASRNQFKLTDIVRTISDVLLDLWQEYSPMHGMYWITTESVTISGTTQEYTISSQDLLGSPVMVRDQDGIEIPRGLYHQQDEYDQRGENFVWFRENPTAPGSMLVGVLYPENQATLVLYKTRKPKILIGGQGIDAGGVLTVPFWGVKLANYYVASQDYFEKFIISNGDIGAVTRGAVASSTAATVTVTDFSQATDDIWLSCPEWAPEAAKTLICKRAAARLLERTELGVSNRLAQTIEIEELKFRRRYTPGADYGVRPQVMKEWMND